MSKAKEAALDWLPKRKDGRKTVYQCNDDDIRRIYAKGYRKAEKDLELIWEDIPEILMISEQLKTSWWFMDNEQTKQIGKQPFWEEVLKRFRDFKERKENGE